MKKKTKLLIKDSFFSSILTSIIVLLLAITFVNITFFNPFVKAFEDFDFLDIYYAENFGNSDAINTDIILVNVQDNSRETIANMLDTSAAVMVSTQRASTEHLRVSAR